LAIPKTPTEASSQPLRNPDIRFSHLSLGRLMPLLAFSRRWLGKIPL